MELWIGALNLGFLYSFMAMGVFITFRVYDFPDITVDGSFTAGAAVTGVLLVLGISPFLTLPAAFLLGAAGGSLTALIHTRFNINGLLAGILVMTGLYSINLHIMGRSNIPLLDLRSCIGFIEFLNPGMPEEIWLCMTLFVVIMLFWAALSVFFRTDLGITIRTTGSNPVMAAASGVNVNRMKVFGIAMSNGLVAVSGSLVAQYQGFADIGMGIGAIVFGLAAVIIGESVLRIRSFYVRILSVVLGSVLFRLMVAFALYVGLNPLDLKLITATFVLITLVASKIVTYRGVGLSLVRERYARWITARRLVAGLCVAGLVAAVLIWQKWEGQSPRHLSSKRVRIGVVQVTDHPLLNMTRDSFVSEMEALGYHRGRNCTIDLHDAAGDLATVSAILDKFLRDRVDVVVTISTPCTQAAIKKIKDRPVVFATVANPFIIGAGKSEKDHLPNVTGVYGWAPMDKTMEIVTTFLPGRLKVGAIWNPAHPNSVFNMNNLKKVIDDRDDLSFVGTTITNSSEVYVAALSLAAKGIDAFVLSPDNTVYSAFESVVKAARPGKIPIFLSDVERLQDGALGVYGYDYTISGIQAARLVAQILDGQAPADLPFERYRKVTFGLNLDVARQMGISIPSDLLSRADVIYGLKEMPVKRPIIGVVQFAQEPTVEIVKRGILQALADNGFVPGRNIEIIYGNANADFTAIHSIIQDFVRQEVDIILPLSTPCLQAAVRMASKARDTKVVFTFIYDPFRVGAARTPKDHPPNITGAYSPPPMEQIIRLIKEMFPKRKRVGVVWNSSEANSEVALLQLREWASRLGLEVLEVAVANPAEVLEASRSLVSQGAQVFLNTGDNTLSVSYDSFAKVALKAGIPLFSADPGFIERETLAALGPDIYRIGYDGGVLLSRVLSGEDPSGIPLHKTTEVLFLINLKTARRGGFKIDKTILDKADKVIGP